MLKRLFITAAIAVSLGASAEERAPLTLDMIFDAATPLGGESIGRYEWIDETSFLWPRLDVDGNLTAMIAVEAVSGEERVLADVDALSSGFEEPEVKALRKPANWKVSDDGKAFLLSVDDDLWIYRVGTDELVRLTETEQKERTASWSPDGTLIGFTRENDLWVLDPSDRSERRLTTTGSETIHNGILDWVYQEEIYGRGDFKGYWWSEDSATIAFLRLDESPVDTFLVVDQIPYLQKVETMHYPKAGSDNPEVSLHTVPVAGGEISTVGLGDHSEDLLVVNVSWSPRHEVLFQLQNRTQTWLELRRASRNGGDSTVLLRESSPAWVDVFGPPHFLPNGTFLWESERDGWRHIYQYSGDGKLLRQVTRGEWEVRELHGSDWSEHWIYFSGTERSPIGLDVYRIRVDGSGLERLSEERGWHDATFSPELKRYLVRWSNIETPPRLSLKSGSGETLRVVHQTEIPALESITVLPVEFVTIPDGDGFEMESMIIRPATIAEEKRYPVYQYIYGGPHAQQVVDRWPSGRSADRFFFHQFLAQNGVGVWVLDNRTASGKGAVATRDVYERFGETEMEDVEDGLDWLTTQPWVDPERIIISGWSYGGFMTLYAMTHSERYLAGIAGGSVTDWRDYDTVYTERYMGLPSENEEAYRKSSPRFAAEDLHGTVLLIHGTIDDNVHMQNTVQMAIALQEAGKDFQMMLYPKSRHGITSDKQREHLYRTMWRFIREMVE